MKKPVYINPLSDFGFKYLFGREEHKHFLIAFLNAILEQLEIQIVDLEYLNTEKKGVKKVQRSAIYDLFCKTTAGEDVIIEVQRKLQKNVVDRLVYYASYSFSDQAKGDSWDYKLTDTIVIGLLDFVYSKSSKENFITYAKLLDIKHYDVVFNKLTVILIELPKFDIQLVKTASKLSKWLYLFKEMEKLERIPEILNSDEYTQLFKKSEVACLNKEDKMFHDLDLKRRRDWHNVMEYAKDEAREEGKEEGLKSSYKTIAHSMYAKGLDIEQIAFYLEIDKEEIRKILKQP